MSPAVDTVNHCRLQGSWNTPFVASPPGYLVSKKTQQVAGDVLSYIGPRGVRFIDCVRKCSPMTRRAIRFLISCDDKPFADTKQTCWTANAIAKIGKAGVGPSRKMSAWRNKFRNFACCEVNGFGGGTTRFREFFWMKYWGEPLFAGCSDRLFECTNSLL